MANSYLESVEGLFEDLTAITPEGVEKLIGETVEYFKDLQERLTSDDVHVREKALEKAKEVQMGLEKQLEGICQKTGLDLAALTTLGTQLKGPDKELTERAGEQFSKFFRAEEREVKRPKRATKINLVG